MRYRLIFDRLGIVVMAAERPTSLILIRVFRTFVIAISPARRWIDFAWCEFEA